MHFNPNHMRLKQNYLDVFAGLRAKVINRAKYVFVLWFSFYLI